MWFIAACGVVNRLKKARKKLRTKKTALEISAFSYVLFLVVVCEFGYLYLAMVMNLVALALGMCACGSGSAKVRCWHLFVAPTSVSVCNL